MYNACILLVGYMDQKKKRVLIFICRGGSAHISAANALKDYLQDQYHVEIVDYIRDILGPIDPLSFVTLRHLKADDFYNWLVRHEFLKKTLPLLVHLAMRLMVMFRKKINRLTYDFLAARNDDLIISTIPFVNGIISDAAKALHKPCIIFPLDLDPSAVFFTDVSCKDNTYAYCALPFEDRYLGYRQRALVPFINDNIAVTGFPIRPEFFDKKNTNELKKTHNIPLDKPVVMLLMGGAGSNNTYQYCKAIARMHIPLHVIVCLGRNKKIRASIERLAVPSSITMSIIDYTDKIADLMAASDVLITKTGPTSICEALYVGTPILLDTTGTVLFWERFHITFVLENKLGDRIDSYNDVEPLLKRYLADHAHIENIINNQRAFTTHRADKDVVKLLGQLLA